MVARREATGRDGTSGGGTTAGATPPFRLGNRPPLTGIRAPALALVVVFHSNFRTLPGSWVALSIFFVLSGFLITAMLAGERQRTGRISLRAFYARRAVRLLPPLVLTVALLGLYALVVPVHMAADRLWGDAAAALFYYSDYRSALGHEPAAGFLAQCWSLAVEEQFYVLWAIGLVLALRFGSRRTAYALAVAGIVACTADRLWVVLSAPQWNNLVAGRAYYAFDTRGDGLLLGCLLGLVATGGGLSGWSRRAVRAATVGAVAATAVLVWITLETNLAERSLPLVWLPVSEVCAALLIVYLVVRPDGMGARFLGWRGFVLVGNMSYTIYLLHWPVYVAINPFTVRWSYWVMDPVRAAIIVPLAVVCWYALERPLTAWRRRRDDGAATTAEARRPATAVPAVVPVAVGAVPGGT